MQCLSFTLAAMRCSREAVVYGVSGLAVVSSPTPASKRLVRAARGPEMVDYLQGLHQQICQCQCSCCFILPGRHFVIDFEEYLIQNMMPYCYSEPELTCAMKERSWWSTLFICSGRFTGTIDFTMQSDLCHTLFLKASSAVSSIPSLDESSLVLSDVSASGNTVRSLWYHLCWLWILNSNTTLRCRPKTKLYQNLGEKAQISSQPFLA